MSIPTAPKCDPNGTRIICPGNLRLSIRCKPGSCVCKNFWYGKTCEKSKFSLAHYTQFNCISNHVHSHFSIESNCDPNRTWHVSSSGKCICKTGWSGARCKISKFLFLLKSVTNHFNSNRV